MSWKERRLITVLSAILMVLVIALVIVLAARYRANMDDGSTVTEEPVGSVRPLASSAAASVRVCWGFQLVSRVKMSRMTLSSRGRPVSAVQYHWPSSFRSKDRVVSPLK